jgi:NAD(P)-dependent dehydrogenase (short-subunit alcohol dehydrogenase family)
MGQLDGKVAFVTGAGRGQGRSHAVRLAQEGADIIAIDSCVNIDSLGYELSSADDLDETARQVKDLGRRVVYLQADVRDAQSLATALDAGVAELGRLDIVSANAGIISYSSVEDMPLQTWDDVIDVNLSGVFKTARPSLPLGNPFSSKEHGERRQWGHPTGRSRL